MTIYHGESIQDVIKRKAYHKYLFRQRYGLPDDQDADWREAEKEVKEEMGRMDTRKFE
jgi:hypothetical protein